MARRRQLEIASVGEDHDDVIAWYRRKLAEPAVLPWAHTGWEPVTIGPTWQVDSSGHWVLPEATIGWDALGFMGCWLQLRAGVPLRLTLEQARWVLWWHSVDETGRWNFHDGIIQRLKGWGKDPMLTWLCATALIGPSIVVGMDGDQPVAGDVDDAWIPIAATALGQTKTTMRLFPQTFSKEALAEFGVVVGKEMIYAYGDARMIQAVTSSPTVLEGIRAKPLTVENETQHWTSTNNGFEMAAVNERNATKSEGGSARTLKATNAPDPARESVALADRMAWEEAQEGRSFTTGILYDSLEAPPKAPLALEQAEGEPAEAFRERTIAHHDGLLDTVRGDSVWLDKPTIIKSILDTRNPPSRSRRFWYNQIYATEDAWVVPQHFERLAADQVPDPPLLLLPADELVVFFDGSKSDDATVLVGSRISDGYVVTLGLWQKPPKQREGNWLAPREDVDRRLREIMATYKVRALWGDPSHTLDDESNERYWDNTLDAWHRDFKDQLKLWAKPGPGGHAVMWDMASPKRTEEFTAAAELTAGEIGDLDHVLLVHDGDRRLISHVRNARRAPNRWGVSLRKTSRESPHKIDLAVGMVGARMVRRAYLNSLKSDTQERSGVVV